MNFLENIRIALESIRVNKMRAILTMLGIIIGISAVITITTIGSSLQATIAASFNKLGNMSNISAYVEAIYPEDEADWETWEYPEMTEKDYISLEEVQKFMNTYSKEVKKFVASSGEVSGKVTSSRSSANVTLTGSTGGNVDVMETKIIAGRDITIRDNVEGKSTAVVSDLFVKNAFNGKSPIGKEIRITLENNTMQSLYVVGVYKYNKKLFGMAGQKVADKDISTPIYVPLKAIPKEYNWTDGGISDFTIITNDDVDAVAFTTEMKEYFGRTKYDKDGLFHIWSYDMASELSSYTKILNIVTIAISIIAAISLVVGGIGVMNIMLVSVVERTREIGIRKALGARAVTIRRQFLMEAVVICFLGGIFGILIGLILGYLFTVVGGQIIANTNPDVVDYLSVAYRPSLLAILISVVFSMLIGIIFGSYPAKRAANLNPIDALRYE